MTAFSRKASFWLIPVLLLACAACKPKARVAQTPEQANAVGEPVPVDRQLSKFTPIAGTSFQLAPIVSRLEKRSLLSSPSSYKSGWEPIHNYLFLNTDTATFTKLLDNNRRLIASTEQFPAARKNCDTPGNCPPRPTKVRSIVYTLITADTNNDQNLTQADRKTIAVSDPSGKNYTEVVQGVDVIYHKVYKAATQRLLVVYQRDGKRLADVIDLVKKRTIESKPLPDIGADVK